MEEAVKGKIDMETYMAVEPTEAENEMADHLAAQIEAAEDARILELLKKSTHMIVEPVEQMEPTQALEFWRILQLLKKSTHDDVVVLTPSLFVSAGQDITIDMIEAKIYFRVYEAKCFRVVQYPVLQNKSIFMVQEQTNDNLWTKTQAGVLSVTFRAP